MKKVLRTLHLAIVPGFAPGTSMPVCFWLNSDVYRILCILKVWQDEWANTFYRVITDRGAFDIYRHKKMLSITKGSSEFRWWLEREIALYESHPPRRKRSGKALHVTNHREGSDRLHPG